MKIRVAMLTGDTVYAERLSAGFNNRYFEKVEVACFTGLDSAKAFFGKSAVHGEEAYDVCYPGETHNGKQHVGFLKAQLLFKYLLRERHFNPATETVL